VRLVARLLEQPERRGAAREPQRLRAPAHEDLLLALREAHERQRREPQRLQRLVRGGELPLAAVDDDEVGERLPLLQPAAEVAPDDLAHRLEVVGALRLVHRLDLHRAVLAPARPPVLEPDDAPDTVLPLRGGVVEADERARELLQAEFLPEVVDGVGGALVGLLLGELELLEQVARVLLGQVDQLALRPALGGEDLRRALGRLLEELAVLEVEGDEQLARPGRGLEVRADEVCGEHVAVGRLLDALEEPVLARDELALPDAEQRDRRVVAVARVADHVAVAPLHLEHHGGLLEALQPHHRVAQLRRALEVERLGRLHHPLLDAAQHLVGAPVEERDDLVDHRAVVGLRLEPDAGGLAAADVVVEAGALRHLARHVVLAGPDREDPLHDVERAAHRRDVGVRPEVAATVAAQLTRHEDSRIRLLHRDLDVRVRLVVPEHHVVLRAVLLDQVLLEHERMRLVGHDDRLEVGDPLDEPAGLRIVGMLGREVAPNPRPQALRLADVQDAARGILPQVDAGELGQVRELEGHRLRRGGHRPP